MVFNFQAGRGRYQLTPLVGGFQVSAELYFNYIRLNITVTSIFKHCTALINYDADSDLVISE